MDELMAMEDRADDQDLPFHTTEAMQNMKSRGAFLIHILCMLGFVYNRLYDLSSEKTHVFVPTAVVCEGIFVFLWLLNQIPYLFRIERKAYPNRLKRRYKYGSGEALQLPCVDVFVTTADPFKEPPLVLVNTVLSVLAVDYPSDKIACYVSDDGMSPFTLFALLKAYEFAKKWVPFCTRFQVELRAPDYFSPSAYDLHDRIFKKDWKEMKEEYEKLKLDITTVVESRQVPHEFQDIFDELCGYADVDAANHPPILKVLGGGDDLLPQLIYISREKRPGFPHHYKAGALNALTRISGVLTNSPFILNLDCDMYINNSEALLQAMCFHLDPNIQAEDRVSFVQFPQYFGYIDENHTYNNRTSLGFSMMLKGLDGLQGPLYCGTGCVHRRQALYGNKPVSQCGILDVKQCFNKGKLQTGLHDQNPTKEKFGNSSTFLASVAGKIDSKTSELSKTNQEQEILFLITSDYEACTLWGKEVGTKDYIVGWMYGSSTEDCMTGMKLHSRGWKSIFYSPKRPAFVGIAPSECPDIFQQRKRWALGMSEIFLSRNCPLFCGIYNKGFLLLQRLIYTHYTVHAFHCIPILTYGALVTDVGIIPFILVFCSMHMFSLIDNMWIGLTPKMWWNDQCSEMNAIASCNVVAVVEVFLKLLGVKEAEFSVTPKPTRDDDKSSSGEEFMFNSSAVFVPPTAMVLLSIAGLTAGIWQAFFHGNMMLGELFCVAWILASLFPFVRGLFRRKNNGGLPLSVIIKSASCISILCACLAHVM
eukprot:Gb_29421 [translate_table: standard]